MNSNTKITGAQRLYEDLRMQIIKDKALPGMLLPSENEFCKLYSISRPTVRRVLERLCEQKLIEKRSGVGTFVRDSQNGNDDPESSEFRIGIDVMVDSGNQYYGKIIQGISRSKYGKNCFYHFLTEKNLENGEYPKSLDAIILIHTIGSDGSIYKLAAAHGKPVVAVNRSLTIPGIGCITVDHRRESELAVEYLLQRGHREIALIGYKDDNHALHLRSLGWEDAFRKAGLKPPVHLKLHADDLYPMKPSVETFIRDKKFSAAFFTLHPALRYFRNEFLRCRNLPLDDAVELMSFDNLDDVREFDDLCCSFVRMPLLEMGEEIINYLHNKKYDYNYQILNKTLPCSMVIRHK